MGGTFSCPECLKSNKVNRKTNNEVSNLKETVTDLEDKLSYYQKENYKLKQLNELENTKKKELIKNKEILKNEMDEDKEALEKLEKSELKYNNQLEKINSLKKNLENESSILLERERDIVIANELVNKELKETNDIKNDIEKITNFLKEANTDTNEQQVILTKLSVDIKKHKEILTKKKTSIDQRIQISNERYNKLLLEVRDKLSDTSIKTSTENDYKKITSITKELEITDKNNEELKIILDRINSLV